MPGPSIPSSLPEAPLRWTLLRAAKEIGFISAPTLASRLRDSGEQPDAGDCWSTSQVLGAAYGEVRICYERAEPLCNSLNDARLLYVALTGQWRYSLHTDKLSRAMQIAERLYSLAREIEASFCEAIRIAKEQKSVSLQERGEATYAEYHRQKASAPAERRFRLPLC